MVKLVKLVLAMIQDNMQCKSALLTYFVVLYFVSTTCWTYVNSLILDFREEIRKTIACFFSEWRRMVRLQMLIKEMC